jgi:hypothetical protein
MSNLDVKIVDDRIFVTVELPLQSPQPSHSGKSMTIASTEGFVTTDQEFPHDGEVERVQVQVNVCIPKR